MIIMPKNKITLLIKLQKNNCYENKYKKFLKVFIFDSMQ